MIEPIRDTYDWFLKLTSQQKNNLFSALIITALVIVIWWRETNHVVEVKELKNDIKSTVRKADSLINQCNQKRQDDIQKYSDKFEALFIENQKQIELARKNN